MRNTKKAFQLDSKHTLILKTVLEDLEVAADPVEVCPLPYTTRLSTVKILMELEMWDEATQVIN